MKFEIDREILADGLKRVKGIAGSGNTMPILNHVLISVEDEAKVKVAATDLQLSLWTSIEARVSEPGSITLPCKRALDLVRSLSERRVAIEGGPDKILISAGRSRFELPTIPAKDFPSVAFRKNASWLECDGDLHLLEALTKTFYVIPPTAEAFALEGTLLTNHMVATTDGHRLAYADMSERPLDDFLDARGIVIPRKGVEEIIKIMEQDGPVWIAKAIDGGHEGDRILIKNSDTMLGCQLIDGEFPDVTLIVPEERPYRMTLDLEAFRASLRRASVVAGAKFQAVKLNFTAGTLELSTESKEKGTARDQMDVEYDGEPFEVAYSLKFVLDVVQNASGDKIILECLDNHHGGIFLSPTDRSITHLIMPMVF